MSTNKRIHIHLGGSDETHACELHDGLTLEAVVLFLIGTGKLGEIKAEEIFLFEEDSDEELPRHHCFTLADHGRHVHAHRCRHITVKFIGPDDKREHTFRPGATIGKLLQWAKDNFNVDKSGKYALRLSEQGEPLPHAAHLGAYVKGPPCELTLYFAPICRIQG